MEERTLDLDDEMTWKNYNSQLKIAILLKNKTSKPIFIDLANSYILLNEQATPYYVPTATTTTQGGTSGGSVNIRAVAGALGVGGSVGTLANGVSVGGSNTHISTTTTYSQRIVSIPPMSTLALDPMEIGWGSTWVTATKREWQRELFKAYNLEEYVPKDLMRGEVVDIPPLDNVNPLGAFLTYSFDEAMSATQTMRMDFYLRQVIGMGWNYIKTAFGDTQCPLVFSTTD